MRRSTGKSHQWYTPDYLVKSIYNVLGSIDLDPASDEEANKRIGAKRIFTVEDTGLEQDWKAETVYLNYPGGRTNNKSNAELWFAKAEEELHKGHCKIILWAGFSIDQLAIVPGIKYYPMCIFRRRIQWLGNGTQPTHQNYYSLLFDEYTYVEEYILAFEQEFKQYGSVGRFASLLEVYPGLYE